MIISRLGLDNYVTRWRIQMFVGRNRNRRGFVEFIACWPFGPYQMFVGRLSDFFYVNCKRKELMFAPLNTYVRSACTYQAGRRKM